MTVSNKMIVARYTPSARLVPFIKEYLLIESSEETISQTLPDTSVVMSFRYAGTVAKTDGEVHEIIPATAATGLRKSARQFLYQPGTSNLLVLFKEGGIATFSNMPANELFGYSIDSENIFSRTELSEVLQQLAAAGNNGARIQVIEQFLLARIRDKKTDLLVANAAHLIRQQKGLVRIKDLASSLYISQDPFEKRFRNQIGATPKQYASIVRLRSLIADHSSYNSLTEACYAAGYFDQSHFIRDFRLFTGRSPKDFFASSLFW